MNTDEKSELSSLGEQSLLSALKEVQDTVRAYDTKAQIVGVGYIFSIGVIVRIPGQIFQPEINPEPWIIVLVWILVIGPIILYGLVLFPSRSMSPSIGKEITQLKHTFYYRPSESNHMSK